MYAATVPGSNAHPVVIYGRVSRVSDQRSKSVDDQLGDLRAWAQREGWPILAEHRDDGVSASRYANGRQRDGWERVLDVIGTGEVRALLVWELSRATRDKAVSAALETACLMRGVKIGYHGRLHDPATADGGFQVGLDTLLAAREAAVTSERTQRAVDARAARGGPHGALPYGYKRIISPETGATVGYEPHPEQAPIVVEIVRRILAGESANGIATELNDRGVPSARGGRWSAVTVSLAAQKPTYAGLRVHNGEVRQGVKGTWPALISEADHYRIAAMYSDDSRAQWRRGKTVQHLGVGLYGCGREGCSGRMGIWKSSGRPPAYTCRECSKVSRQQKPVDDLVQKLMWRRLAKPDVLELLTASSTEAVQQAAAEVNRLEMKLRAARDAWDRDRLSLDSYTDMENRLLPQIKDAQRRARPESIPPVVFAVAGPDAEARWFDLDVVEKRTAIAALLDVTILPAGTARIGFDPDLIQVKWRSLA
jgi:DNA invertase Pin-like site-specific DNA recombinase